MTHPILQRGALGNDQEAVARYGRLYIPDNLYIVGTVNMDETTYPFSKKVLDRANTIEFSEVDLLEDFEDSGSELLEPSILPNGFLKSDYLTLKECKAYKQVAMSTIQELMKVNEILEQAQMHFAYRVRDEIVFYMIYNHRFELMSTEEALDRQLLQKVLPRISGNTTKVKEVLEQLGAYVQKRLGEGKSYEKILFMIKRYEQDGFTSYWM